MARSVLKVQASTSNLPTYESETAMKKIVAALLVAVSVSGLNVFACGGMTQIDPPSLMLQTGPSEQPLESILDEISEVLVIC
ncbi:MAG: hypothetical protein M9894_19510 [Planctomycetes bacterium]|nr:hypothetical protein [Planctomycetota bacterium]